MRWDIVRGTRQTRYVTRTRSVFVVPVLSPLVPIASRGAGVFDDERIRPGGRELDEVPGFKSKVAREASVPISKPRRNETERKNPTERKTASNSLLFSSLLLLRKKKK
jgi:hypothetical protein